MPYLYDTTYGEMLRGKIVAHPMRRTVGQRPVREAELVANAEAVSIGNSFAPIPELPTNVGDATLRFGTKKRDQRRANAPSNKDATQGRQQ
jgi:hypothetical protein